MKLLSIILAFTATFAVLSSTSVPSLPTKKDVPVQFIDFEKNPLVISVKK